MAWVRVYGSQLTGVGRQEPHPLRMISGRDCAPRGPGSYSGCVSRKGMTLVPGAFLNPAYILLCLAAGVVGYLIAFSSGQMFREGLFQFMTSFSCLLYTSQSPRD